MLFSNAITLDNGKRFLAKTWDFLLFYRRTFSESVIEIPSDKVLQMHSPILDGELRIDGEGYIL